MENNLVKLPNAYIRSLAAEYGKTQEEMAEIMGVSINTYKRNIEREGSFRVREVAKLGRYFNLVTMDPILFCGQGFKFETEAGLA